MVVPRIVSEDPTFNIPHPAEAGAREGGVNLIWFPADWPKL
jgi:hypothetical protein